MYFLEVTNWWWFGKEGVSLVTDVWCEHSDCFGMVWMVRVKYLSILIYDVVYLCISWGHGYVSP